MLADKLGRCGTGTEDSPCTLQVAQLSRQIFSCKLIATSLCSMQRAVDKDEQQAQRQKADGETDQHKEGPKELEHRRTPCALLLDGGEDSSGRKRLVSNSTSGDIQERHSQAPFFTRRSELLRCSDPINFRRGTYADPIKGT
jgi:hypothetical protein